MNTVSECLCIRTVWTSKKTKQNKFENSVNKIVESGVKHHNPHSILNFKKKQYDPAML